MITLFIIFNCWFQKRIYPDGTFKILHQDGSQETHYANGRVRIKNAAGKLVHDSQGGHPAQQALEARH